MAEITLKINRSGNQPGTLGWLAEKAATIHVGTTKNGRHRGCWLQDKDGKTLTVLCLQGWHDGGGEITKVERLIHEDGITLQADFSCTDSCWEKLEEIIDYAAGLLEEDESAEDYRVLFMAARHDTPIGVCSDWLKERQLIPQDAVVEG
jgi:hypothetical protein